MNRTIIKETMLKISSELIKNGLPLGEFLMENMDGICSGDTGCYHITNDKEINSTLDCITILDPGYANIFRHNEYGMCLEISLIDEIYGGHEIEEDDPEMEVAEDEVVDKPSEGSCEVPHKKYMDHVERTLTRLERELRWYDDKTLDTNTIADGVTTAMNELRHELERVAICAGVNKAISIVDKDLETLDKSKLQDFIVITGSDVVFSDKPAKHYRTIDITGCYGRNLEDIKYEDVTVNFEVDSNIIHNTLRCFIKNVMVSVKVNESRFPIKNTDKGSPSLIDEVETNDLDSASSILSDKYSVASHEGLGLKYQDKYITTDNAPTSDGIEVYDKLFGFLLEATFSSEPILIPVGLRVDLNRVIRSLGGEAFSWIPTSRNPYIHIPKGDMKLITIIKLA